MLNRVKKLLIVAILSASLSGIALASESTISYVNINNLAYQDIEVVITDDAKMLVPFKQLADLFNVQYSANRVDKIITFKTFDGKNCVINQNGVFIDDYPISNVKPIFLTAGIMDGVFNEAYLTSDVVEKLLQVKLETDYESLSLNASVERDIPILRNLNNVLSAENIGPQAYQDIVSPKKPAKITLNKIGLRSYLLSDNMSTTYQGGDKNINDTFSGSTQLSINGNILDGKYRVEATEMHYRNDVFMFGGVTGAYSNKFTMPSGKKYWYELGSVKGVSDQETSLGTNIFGGQIWNYDYDKENPQDINGYVKPTSLVRLTVNELEPQLLSTYSGYYSLKDVQLPNPVKYILLEEINEDGSTEVIREERYNIYGKNRPFETDKQASVFAGVWGYQNRFFREGNDIYRGNNKKVTAGIDYQHGIKDNVTFESKLTADKLYEKNGTSLVYRLPTSDTLLVSGTQKSVNYREGVTSLNSIEMVNSKNKDIKAKASGGVSIVHDIREDFTRAGYGVKLQGEYNKNLTHLEKGILKPRYFNARAELFNSSQDFYIASSDSTTKSDRTGGKVSAGLAFNSTNVGGYYSRYYSNLNHRYEGGTLKFDEASVNAGTAIPKVADLRFSGYYRRGANELGRNKNYNYDAYAQRYVKNWFSIRGGRREYVYDTDYLMPDEDHRNYYSKFADNYAQIDVPIPGGYGKFTFGHDMIRYKTSTYNNGYNMFRFGYTFPTWKRLTLGVGYGFRYYGQGGNDFNVNLGYNAKSGQTINLGYQYSQNGGYFIDNMFTPTTNRHSVTFGFNDAFQIFNHGLKSVGHEDLDKGIFEAIAFVDVNKDGKFDRKIDIPIKDVPLVTSWGGDNLLTGKLGRAYSSSLEQGVYRVSINMNELPINVAPLTNDLISRTVKISGGQTTRLEIPLVSTVGSVSGKLKIFDEYDRNLQITDFVVVILDENGEEVNYSTVDATGEFYISGLAPGQYKLQLDERFISSYGLETVNNKSYIDINIPKDYYNPTDITDIDLEYNTLSL